MNLADAIRQAATLNGTPSVTATATAATVHAPSPLPLGVEESIPLQVDEVAASVPTTLVDHSSGTTMVRMELFLTPEQLSGLFRSVISNQHSVMTIRDAAAYLRLPTHVIEQFAQEQKLPGLLIDGKWRFTRTALDEWLNVQHANKKGA